LQPQVYYNTSMKLDKKRVKLIKMSHKDDSFVIGTPAQRIGMIWELTQEFWSLGNRQDAERRLQRNVAVLIMNKKATGREKDRLDAAILENSD
jgi:hypothetical protein